MRVHSCTFQMRLCRHFGHLTFSVWAELAQGMVSRCSQHPSEAACPRGGSGSGEQADTQQCKDAGTSVQAAKRPEVCAGQSFQDGDPPASFDQRL